MSVDLLTIFLRNVGTNSEGEQMSASFSGAGHVQSPGEVGGHPALGKKVCMSSVIGRCMRNGQMLMCILN